MVYRGCWLRSGLRGECLVGEEARSNFAAGPCVLRLAAFLPITLAKGRPHASAFDPLPGSVPLLSPPTPIVVSGLALRGITPGAADSWRRVTKRMEADLPVP